MPELRVINVADTDLITALLDRRVRLDPLDLVLGVSSKPFTGANVSLDLYLTEAAGAHLDSARTRTEVKMHRSSHLQSALKGPLRRGRRRSCLQN